MKFLAVDLRFPKISDLARLPLCFALGGIVGLALQAVTHGDAEGVIAEGMAALTAGFLAAAGANRDSGWRGAAICLMGALCCYGIVLALL